MVKASILPGSQTSKNENDYVLVRKYISKDSEHTLEVWLQPKNLNLKDYVRNISKDGREEYVHKSTLTK